MWYRRSIAVFLVMGVCLATGCSSARPTLESVAARILQADAKGVDLALDLAVKNGLPIPLKSPGGKYGLDLAGTPFLKSDKVPGLNLAAGKLGTVTVPARVEYADLIGAFKNLAGAKEIPYKMHGALKFPMIGGDYDLPFSHEDVMPGPADMIRKGAEKYLKLP